MNLHRLSIASLFAMLALTTAAPGVGAERHFEAAERLRELEDFDAALANLEELQKRADLPEDVRQAIPLEKAITLLQGMKTIKHADQHARQLDRAQALLEQFLKVSPEHARAEQASTELAQVFVGRCRAAVLQSRSPQNAARKAEFQTMARQSIGEARKRFQESHDKRLAATKEFPVYIDKTKDPAQHAAREKMLVSYIQAQLNLAICTYEEAQSYDKEAAKFRQLLTTAAIEFEQIHARYRSMVAGLFARMWQGKCFEEQDDITKAMGIYNELLEHAAESPALKTLQDRVYYFRLICLNRRKDYQVVMQAGSNWMKGASTEKKSSQVGVGIQREMERALEGLAAKVHPPAPGKSKPDPQTDK